MIKEKISNDPIQPSEEGNGETIYSEINVEKGDSDKELYDSVSSVTDDENNNNDGVDDDLGDDYDDDDSSVNKLSDSDDNEELYSLFSIPIVGVICTISVFIFKT